jgi:RNA polymerase sigma-70 factor (ECF subfamily)
MGTILQADNALMDAKTADATLVELLDQVASANQQALKQLYELTSGRLYGLALRILREPQWAEDALQETFLSVWRSAASYRASLSPPMAWLGLMVRSRALDVLRRQNAEGRKLTEELDETLSETLESDMPDPMQMSLASEQSVALHVCLSRLENKQREVVSLAYLRDLSHSELAAQLQLPLGTVKTWIRRGLDQLRTCMARFA